MSLQNRYLLNLNENLIYNMNSNREKQQRNITPNFLRFKRTSTGKKIQSSLQQKQQNKNTQRSSSKNSRTSFEVYQKRVLHLSKLKNTLIVNNDKKKQEIQENSLKRKSKQKIQVTCLRKGSLGKNQQNIAKTRIPQQLLTRKRSSTGSSSSTKQIQPISRQKSQKRTEQSLQKQQHRAKLINQQLMANMMNQKQIPNYMNKLKIKKMENQIKKKKKRLLNLIIQIKPEEELGHYDLFGELGKGAYGIVRMGMDKRNGKKVAVKVYEKKRLDEPNKIKNLERQINILSGLDCPVIAKLIQAIQTPQQIYLVQQYGGANSLYNYLLSKPQHRLTQAQAKLFFKTIAETLYYLHQKNIVHRDIKAENILLNRDKNLKLIDFGFSIQTKPPATIDTFCGTPTYMAPQIVSKRDHVAMYTDLWSMGILFFVMLQGNYPFRAKSQTQLFEIIKKGNFKYIHDDITDQSKKLIQSLLKVNPLQRLTAEDLVRPEMLQWYLMKPVLQQKE